MRRPADYDKRSVNCGGKVGWCLSVKVTSKAVAFALIACLLAVCEAVGDQRGAAEMEKATRCISFIRIITS